ncbi:MAG: DNA-processing protein DprA [Akkermansia sp.]|nr:DNA-processing protein DprA [Akkermansia sp.]
MPELTPREALITLNLIPGLGSIRIQALLEHFGSAELALAAPAAMLQQVPRIGPAQAAAIADWQSCTNVFAEMEAAESLGVRMVTLQDAEYPAALRRMADPPVVLYVRGAWQECDSVHGVAIVGTRRATPYGVTVARKFARELADAGCTIVSGLARGIDTAAHTGALDAGGRTIAVAGFGLADLYPPENAELVERMLDGHGALVSEFPLYMRANRNTFPQRNRIVAAWSRATLVVEAPAHSGALHTARLAADHYGSNVFAVPGAVTQTSSAGCHQLIRDGAILCTSPHELMEDMGWGEPRQLGLFDREPSQADLPDSPESALIAALRAGHDTLDALCSALGMGAGEITPMLMRLQVQRRIQTQSGGRFSAV